MAVRSIGWEIGEWERLDAGDDEDVEIHIWPDDSEHFPDMKCHCSPRLEIDFANGAKFIVHRKAQ